VYFAQTSIVRLERAMPGTVTGQILSPTLEATRTEPEFVTHIARTVNLDPLRPWIFVVDNLNTHVSESLVNWVAE